MISNIHLAPPPKPEDEYIDLVIDGARVSVVPGAEIDEVLLQWVKDYCAYSVTSPGAKTITNWIIVSYVEEFSEREIRHAHDLSDNRKVHSKGFAPKSYRDGGRYTYFVKTTKPQQHEH